MPDENLPLCACGCGERTTHRPGRKTNRYRHGHWQKSPELRSLQAAQRAARMAPVPLPNPSGLCQCGCGQTTPLAKATRRASNIIRGEHLRFVRGHQHFSRREHDAPVTVEPPNPDGLCMCGCGETTTIAKRTDYRRQTLAGQHVRYIRGHQNHTRRGDKAIQWKGGRAAKHSGYVRAYAPDHPKAVNCYVDEHRLVAEQELGRYLADGEIVHHLNEVRDDNRPENLIVLASHNDHYKLHAFLRAIGLDIHPVEPTDMMERLPVRRLPVIDLGLTA